MRAETLRKLAALDHAIDAMECRHNCRRDEFGMLPRDHREISECIESEERRRERLALRYLWKGDEQPDHCKHRNFGIDEYLEPWLPKGREWLAPIARLWRRLRVTSAIARGRWGIEWRTDQTGPERLRSWNAVDVCFFENSRDGYGYSVLVLRYHPAQDRVSVSSDGESFM